MFLTRAECATYFDCSEDTIDRRKNKMRQYRIYDPYLFIDNKFVRIDPVALLHYSKCKYLLEHGCHVPSVESFRRMEERYEKENRID